jgi:hypothetical protein
MLYLAMVFVVPVFTCVFMMYVCYAVVFIDIAVLSS